MKFFIHLMVLGAFVFILLEGCATHRAYYDIELSRVKRSEMAVERYGPHDITMVGERGPDVSFYEDSAVKIVWTPSASRVAFTLTNKLDQPVRILWNEAQFIDDEGNRHKVIHSGVSYERRNDPLPPTEIEAGGALEDYIVSVGNIYYSDARWKEKPLFPTVGVFKRGSKMEEEAGEHVGKTFEILLPLDIENEVNEYLFEFAVTSAEVQ